MTTEKPVEESKTESEGKPTAEAPKAGKAEPTPGKAPEAGPTPPPPPPPGLEDRRDFWDTAATYLKKAKDEVVRSSRIGKIRLDIARVKKQRKDLLSEFGEKAYELIRDGKLTSEAMEELKVAVDEKNALIAAKEAEIEAITAEEAAEEEASQEKS